VIIQSKEKWPEDGDVPRASRRIDKPGLEKHLRVMKIDEGQNPTKVGSLFGDKPISSFFETLWYRVKDFSFGKSSS
jgi:hypothetical protein